MEINANPLYVKLEEYKKKYYSNELLKGLFYTAAVVLATFLLLNTLEYFGRFGTSVRAVLFSSFLLVFAYTFATKLYKPLLYFFSVKKPLNYADFATQIGSYFPEIKDKLLNTLQLSNALDKNHSDLIEASIAQKTKDLTLVKFTDAINKTERKKYTKYALIPAALIALILLVYPSYFVESSKRIVDFKNEYAEPAPFRFAVLNKSLKAFKNEDYTLHLKLEGTVVPENLYLVLGDKKIPLDKDKNNSYTYIFRNIQKEQIFHFEAAGFTSGKQKIEVVNRPTINGIKVQLTYPNYLHKANTSMENAGNFIVPEGTIVTWSIAAQDTDSLLISFAGEGNRSAQKSFLNDEFEIKKQVLKNTDYQIKLFNEHSSNANAPVYNISVVADEHPAIALEQYRDTTLFNYIVLGGRISDDYGLTALKVHYSVSKEGAKPSNGSVNIPIDRSQSIQSFYHSWLLDSLKLNPGDKLNYYVQVWDNDGVHGPKASKSEMLEYKIPTTDNIAKNIDNALENTEKQMDKVLKEAEELKKELNKLEQKLKNNPELNFQEKKQFQELMKKRDELMNELRQLQEKNQLANNQQERFDKMKPELTEKMNQLDKLIKDMLNNDNKKLYENLKEMLEKNQNEKMLEELEKLKNKEGNLEKDIERAMKLFKKLEKERKIDKAIKDLLEQAQKQDKLGDESKKLDEQADGPDKDKKEDELEKKQDELENQFEKTKEDLNDAEKLSEELKEENKFDGDKKSQEEISKEQKKSKDSQKKKENKEAAGAQKKAAAKMKNLAEKLADEKKSAEMEQMEENEDDMRQILENLVKLSFDQEQLMKDFRNIRIGDPRFLKLAQQQVKLKDDAKVIEDSLYALAGRVFQIKSFITKELSNMKYHMDGSSESIKDRALNNIAAKQQFAMTSMNNLALMLSDALKDMQMSMMDMSGKGKPKKNKKKLPMPMSEMQQKLNEKMKGTTGKDGKDKNGKKGDNGKEGNNGAEQLAKLAAEQAKIRRMVQELMDSQQGTDFEKKMGDKMNELLKKMDQTETDIVNKNITPQTMQRQKEIEVRLLESEKALKEQEEDEQRKANTAFEIPKTIPKELEQYIKSKQKQTELIRTVPPNLSNFYKKEVDAYFKRINQ